MSLAFRGNQCIGRSRFEREIRAAILENNASAIHYHAAAEPHVVALNEGDGIAVAISGTEIDRIPCEATRSNGWLRPQGIDERSPPREIVRLNECGRIDAHMRRICEIGAAVCEGQLLRFHRQVNRFRRKRISAEWQLIQYS